MIVKSHLHSIMRGTVGGLTYTANRYAQIVARAYTVPVQPQSWYQQLIKSSMSKATAQWENTAQANRDHWEAYALTVTLSGPQGDYIPTGRDMFIAGYASWQYMTLRFAGLPAASDIWPHFDGLLNIVLATGYLVGPPAEVVVACENPNPESICFHIVPSIAYGLAHKYHTGPWNPRESKILVVGPFDVDQITFPALETDRRYFFKVRATANPGIPPLNGHRISSLHYLGQDSIPPPP